MLFLEKSEISACYLLAVRLLYKIIKLERKCISILKNFSNPQPPFELKVLTHLFPRISLSQSSQKRLENLKKGFLGEQKLYKLIDLNLIGNFIALYGLQLEIDQTELQIDCLLITYNKIYLIEVKNYYGDYYINDDKWYSIATNKEIRNPIHQLKRSKLMFQQLLQQLNLEFSVESNLIFVNNGFFLYQAPYEKNIIFPTQIQRFFNEINKDTRPLQKKHKHLADQIASQHISLSHHARIPAYRYEEFKKGLVCKFCTKFLLYEVNDKGMIRCLYCNHEEELESLIMGSIAELHLLFPEKRITVSVVKDWCSLELSRKQIFTILKKNMKLIGRGKGSYYVFKK